MQRTTTDAHGAYTVHMTGADVRVSFGTATNFDLTAQLPRTASEVDGPSVRAGFLIQRADLAVPALRFWEPAHVTVGGDARTITLDWTAMDGVHDYTARFSGNGQEILFGPTESTMDARALEDARSVLHISAAAGEPGPDTTATGDGQFAKITLPTPVTARYVRVHGSPGSKLTGLTQLSVWP